MSNEEVCKEHLLTLFLYAKSIFSNKIKFLEAMQKTVDNLKFTHTVIANRIYNLTAAADALTAVAYAIVQSTHLDMKFRQIIGGY